MKLVNLILSALLLIIKVSCYKKTEEEVQELVILNEKTFEKYISKNEFYLVFFHSPWCRWSQRMEKALLLVNKVLRFEAQPSYIGQVDTTLVDYKPLIKKFISPDIMSEDIVFPRLVFFQSGKGVELYNGMLKSDDILVYIKRYYSKLEKYTWNR